MMKIKNIAIALMAFVAFATTVNAQNPLEGKEEAIDRAAKEAEVVRQQVTDASMLNRKSFYGDAGDVYDGNATVKITGVGKDKAYQGWSIGPSLGFEVFGSNATPTFGVVAANQYRGCRGDAEFNVGIGKPDELSDNQDKFIEFNGYADGMLEVWKTKDYRNEFLVGAYGCFKAYNHAVSLRQDNFRMRSDAKLSFNFGGGLTFGYIYSPKWSSWYHVIQLRAGVNHRLHTEKDIENHHFDFGGKKAYFQASLTYKLMLGISKRHKKAYNEALLKQGKSKQQIDARVNY